MHHKHDDCEISSTICEFLQDCLVNGFSKRTRQSYKSSLKCWQDFLDQQGITLLSEITPQTVLQYRHYLQSIHRSKKGQPLAVSTQAQKLATLKAYLSFCVHIGKTLLNPAQEIPLPKLPKPLPRGILTRKQVQKLLRLPDIRTPIGFRDRLMLELFYSTGVRRSEMAEIKTVDCQLNEKRLFISKGKGGTQRWLPLGIKVSHILKEYLQTVRPALVKNKSHDILLVGNRGGPLKGPRIHTFVSGYLKRLGIKSDCHGLRHTCATHLLKGKANIRVIQSFLGHVSLNSTQIYTRVDISDMARAIEKSHPREKMQCDEP